MRFYNHSHPFYCGIDLHAKSMYLCILDQAGHIVLHQDMPTDPATFLEAIAPFRDGLVVACECLFCWYWLADLCQTEKIDFVLGHALYMKAIHGGKSKDDKIDSKKIAQLLRGGNLPIAYVYPRGLRETRDLLRRRMYLVHKRAEVVAHYARLIRPRKTSAGKVTGGGGGKIGNAHLKWAFSEAACLLARESDQAKRFLAQGEAARQAQGPGHSGSAAGTGRLSHTTAEESVRSETFLEWRAQSKTGRGHEARSQTSSRPEAHREITTSRQGSPVRFGGMTLATKGERQTPEAD